MEWCLSGECGSLYHSRMFGKLFSRWFGKKVGSDTGSRGERIAEEFLLEKEFKVLERNWRNGRDEIDLICVEEETLVFVEVKTRRAGGLVPGYYSVNKRKKTALKRAALAYLKRRKLFPNTTRLDVVEVNLDDLGGREVVHFENIPFLEPAGERV